MNENRLRIIYLHGFNSSPASQKVRLLVDYCHSRDLAEVVAPALPHDPERAIAMLEKLLAETRNRHILLVGSSLGGYYATWLAERHNLRAALINPAVAPCDHLPESVIGRQRNLHTGEEYDFTLAHVESLRKLNIERIADPGRYLLLVQTGDETLDHRLALKFYAGCRQVVQEGGSHSFDNFEDVLPLILQFADH